MKLNTTIIILLAIFLISSKAYTQDFKLKENLATTQSVFIHTDKENYYAGDTIFFKAYVLNNKNQADSGVYNLYVDLLYPSGYNKFNSILLQENGFANGQFILSDTISGGAYILRAYTNYMRNFDASQFFFKPISINNDDRFFYEKNLLQKNKKYIRTQNKVKFKLYVEGGNLLLNKENKIYCNSEDNILLQKPFKGIVYGKNKEIIANFNSEKPFFFITPKKDENYKVNIEYGKEKFSLKLPEAKKNKFNINYLEVKNNKHYFIIKNNKPQTFDTISRTVICYVKRGNNLILTKKVIAINSDTKFNINSNKIPQGIITITVTDINNNELSELNFFNKNTEGNIAKIETKETNDNLAISFSNKNKLSNVSVSVVCNLDTNYNNSFYTNIKRHTELCAANSIFNNNELKPNIKVGSINAATINTNFKEEKNKRYKNYLGVKIQGKVTSQMLNIPIKNQEVFLFVLNKFNDIYTVKTDNKGKFMFDNLQYYDTLDVNIEAYKTDEKNGFLIIIKEDTAVKTSVFTINDVENLKKGRKDYKKRFQYVKKDSTNKSSSIHGNADQVIDFSKIGAGAYSNALQVIDAYVPGISEFGESSLRGRNSINLSNEPLYLLDDIPTNKSNIGNISPQDVDRVEILRSLGKTAIYGSRGANGVIAVYTKKGSFSNIGKVHIRLLGFLSEVEFLGKASEINNIETTIYWNPMLKTNTKGEVKFNVKLPTGKYSYNIIIQGITDTGETIYINRLFEHR